ncbi:MAG: hypothetical protein IKD00_03880 [Candidatus Methanomethylophilaceae archaeon]|nr:hypothetical protein [Candidatus Methanomethylophilaceae archaeon]
MATKSFFTDMVIDTPEAAANLEALIEEGRLTDIDWPENVHEITMDELEEMVRNYERKHDIRIRRLNGNDEADSEEP